MLGITELLRRWNLFCKYNESGQNKEKTKAFRNVIHPPLIATETSVSEHVIARLPPPELHLLIGAVSTLYKRMEERFPETDQKLLEDSNITPSNYYGGSFTGNDSQLLLKNIDSLATNCPVDCLPFLKVFRSLDQVVHSCFSSSLGANFDELIHRYRDDYISLGISVTPKIHAIFYHVSQFCHLKKEGLGKYCDQSSESVHRDFCQFWKNYMIKDFGHFRYADRLFRAVLAYNGRHV